MREIQLSPTLIGGSKRTAAVRRKRSDSGLRHLLGPYGDPQIAITRSKGWQNYASRGSMRGETRRTYRAQFRLH
ncbi:hypothetical protein ACVXHA_08095 [Escherichia coli]